MSRFQPSQSSSSLWPSSLTRTDTQSITTSSREKSSKKLSESQTKSGMHPEVLHPLQEHRRLPRKNRCSGMQSAGVQVPAGPRSEHRDGCGIHASLRQSSPQGLPRGMRSGRQPTAGNICKGRDTASRALAFGRRRDGRYYRKNGNSNGEQRTRASKSSLPSAGIKHKGTLLKHGYDLEESEESRHRALDRVEKAYGYRKSVEKLTALEAVNEHHPAKREKLHSDIEYLQKKHSS